MDIVDIGLLVASPFVGSFLGLLTYRLPEHEDVIFARSKCRSCGRVLAPRDLVPLVSFALNAGKCRFCKAAIPPAYPLIELGAVLIAASAIWATDGWLSIVTCLLGWAMLVLFATDIRTFILPNLVTLPLIPIGLVIKFLLHGATQPWFDCLIGAVAGGAVLWGTALLYRALRGRTGLGMGDVKLFAAAGAWLGWHALPLVMLGASVIVLVSAIILKLTAGKSLNKRTLLPLGAGLAPAIYVIWLLQVPAHFGG